MDCFYVLLGLSMCKSPNQPLGKYKHDSDPTTNLVEETQGKQQN